MARGGRCIMNSITMGICIPKLISWLVVMAVVVDAHDQAPPPIPVVRSEPDMHWQKVHGFLMWASFGFLLPLGLIIVRFSKSIRQGGVKSRSQLDSVRYAHIIIQLVGITFATVGGAVALHKFGDVFRYTHQRLGLALLILVWLQFFVGLIRPRFGSGIRPFWYGLHWILGTGAAILGFINIFIGMRVYELISQRSLRTFNILFSIQLGVFAVAYLLQDRLEYVQEQGRLPHHISPSVKPSNGPV